MSLIRRVIGGGSGGGAGVDSTDIGYDLILLLGQSNMAGYSTGYDATRYDVTDPRVLQYGSTGTYASVISQAVEPLAMHDSPTGIGPGLHFARWYLHSVEPNRRVLLIPAAHNGTALSTNTTPLGWRRGVSGNLYALALAQAQAALTAAGANARIVAALWVQGETDGDNSVSGATYQTDLDALIAGLRTDLSLSTLPFVIGGMVPEYLSTGTRAAIDQVHADTPYRLAYAAYTAGPTGANLGDGNHYSAAGQRRQGRNMFDAYLLAKDRSSPLTPSAPAAPTGLAASSVTDTTLTLTWTPPAGIVTSYTVERSAHGANSWSTIGTPTAATLAVTGLTASTSYDFRVSATNTAGTGPTSSVLTQSTTSGGPTTYAADTFTRADSSSLGSTETGSLAWATAGVGTWSIASNKLAVTSGSDSETQAVVNTSQSDGTITLTRSSASGASYFSGVVFRAADAVAGSSAYLLFLLSGTTYSLRKRTALDTFTEIATGSGGSGDGDVVTIVLSGSSIIVKINGTQIISITDSSYTGTRHGAFTWGTGSATFDGFSHTS